ncbi:heparan-alpha-glucosaminide N-acetyltransferase domain-containing protein [Wenyingzhuangia sp. chi5]|uniref:Heparan-alpha-glucosaminide N-acetyltransferase domain-containing protein n=1 Tax=Wenyingzhuangia gilva TaxID=3057677 RepID=A0ABT8VUK2_9FLAO|nr:heparan-alpha-glucosaminide N-acetyltransferase domain-containing protein [Wenyingzhuangia sp. chi5]MDO3695638.1 heparan-alpha-glucosaminide N-acetyltransferase domain-containing protein [Wenyingzhuangia sp. chi5]
MKEAILKKTNRFLSLDVFRGLTICLMIVVNTPGTGAKLYPYLVHAHWFGFTLADLVFPSFLFAMGNAMSFSMTKLKDAPSVVFWKKVFKRTVIIFLLGYLMYWFPFFRQGADGWELKPISETRVMGVLQRIAICYFITSLLFYYLKEKTVLLLSAMILICYWEILYLFGTTGSELEMATNAITRLDLTILGEGHIYKRDSIPFDPEGILSTLPSVVNVIGGYLAGKFIQQKGKSFEGISKLLIAGFLLSALALWWDLVFPMSKKLWTSPFVLHTVGIDLSVMAILIYFIELKNTRKGTEFFNIFGKNPMFIYLFSELFYITLRMIPTSSGLDVFEWVSEKIFQRLFPGSFGAFVTAIVFMLLCWSIGWWLNKKKIYIKI